MKAITRLITLLVAGTLASPLGAHHSYAMFDGSKHLTVQGTLAKLEWRNPHVFIWVYVAKAEAGDPALYAFESDSVNTLIRRGWTKDSLKPGEKLTIEFFALRDGRSGGHLIKATKADGSALVADPGPIKVLETAPRLDTAPGGTAP